MGRWGQLPSRLWLVGRDVVLIVPDLFRAIGGPAAGVGAAQVSCHQPGNYSFARFEENKWDAGDSFPPGYGWLGGTLSSTSLIFSGRLAVRRPELARRKSVATSPAIIRLHGSKKINGTLGTASLPVMVGWEGRCPNRP